MLRTLSRRWLWPLWPPADTSIEDFSWVEEDLVEFINLREIDTGVPGTIYISTEIGGPGPRVKYYAGRAGKTQPSLSVSIAPAPRVLVSSLPEHITCEMAPQVIDWVAQNHEALRRFWDEGNRWYADEVERFRRSLKRV
jgi:hypothetical protein